MMIFHSYVSLPEGIHCFHIILTHWLGESWRASKNHVDWWGWNLQKRTFTNPWIPPWSLVEEVSASIVLSAQQHFFSLAWRCSPTKAGRFTKIGWDLNDQTPKTRGIWIHISANSIWDCHGLIDFSSLEVRVACRPSVCRFTGLSVFPAEAITCDHGWNDLWDSLPRGRCGDVVEQKLDWLLKPMHKVENKPKVNQTLTIRS